MTCPANVPPLYRQAVGEKENKNIWEQAVNSKIFSIAHVYQTMYLYQGHLCSKENFNSTALILFYFFQTSP